MLETYRQKRDFTRTSEPEGRRKARSGSQSFVVQRHRARREHFDFRLEIDGVLKSWAVTRGPSAKPSTRRLAVRTEDHPIDYAQFEGVIPPKSYGAGPVMIWDRGRWLSDMDPDKALAEGHFKFTLTGERMRGRWALVRLKGEEKRENWLLIKDRDAFAEKNDSLAERFVTSVVSGRDFPAILAGKKGKRVTAAPRVPEFVPPMLCTPSAKLPTGKDWIYEMKYDGYRLQVAVAGGNVVIRTRKGLDWTARFPSIAAAAAALAVDDAIIDGEAMVLDDRGVSDFPALVSALESGSPHIMFVAFDMPRRNGKRLAKVPYSKRRAMLDELLAASDVAPAIRLAPTHEAVGEALLNKVVAGGGEGLIAKRLDAHYRSGRSHAWLKVKAPAREDVVIVGYTPSTKDRAIASLAVAIKEGRKLRYVGRVGTGYTDQGLATLGRELLRRRRDKPPAALVGADDAPIKIKWVAPDLSAEVRFGGWTADKRMRAAAFLGLREDMSAMKPASKTDGAKRPSKRGADADRPVNITHPDRVVFPETGFTKGDVADYYRHVAKRMLPHLAGRVVSLVRAPDGVGGETFFQRHPMPGMKRGVIAVDAKGKERQPYMVLEGEMGVLTAVQFGAIEFHGWGAKMPEIEAPDRVVFDLDPAEDVLFSRVKEAAEIVRKVVESAGLKSFPLVSGGKGVHVVVPLDGSQGWEEAEAFTSGVAKNLARVDGEHFTAAMRKAKRTGRIFIDWLRNKRSATAIVPYSLRARDANSVAVPVTWRALKDVKSADAFRPADVMKLGRDPWSDFFKVRQRISVDALKMLSSAG